MSNLVDQGQPGTQGPWPVTGSASGSVFPIKPSVSANTQTAKAITLGGTSETALAASATRTYMLIVNDSDTVMYLRISGSGAATTGDMYLAANGGNYESPPNFCPVVAITILCATTGKTYCTVEA